MTCLNIGTSGRRLGGQLAKTLVATINDPVSHFGAPWRPFWIFEILIEGMIESKTYLEEIDGSAQKPMNRPLSRPCWPFWGPMVAILDF